MRRYYNLVTYVRIFSPSGVKYCINSKLSVNRCVYEYCTECTRDCLTLLFCKSNMLLQMAIKLMIMVVINRGMLAVMNNILLMLALPKTTIILETFRFQNKINSL